MVSEIPDTAATNSLRAAVRPRRDLVAHRVAACNQLRTQLAVAAAVLTAHVTELRDRDCCSHGVLSGGERTFSSGGLGETQAGERVTK